MFASETTAPEKQLAANAAQPVAAYAGKMPPMLWEANGALMLQRGAAAPARFAESATAASLASGEASSVIAWEGTVGGAKTILLARVR